MFYDWEHGIAAQKLNNKHQSHTYASRMYSNEKHCDLPSANGRVGTCKLGHWKRIKWGKGAICKDVHRDEMKELGMLLGY